MPHVDDKEMFAKPVRLERVYPDNLQSHFVSNVVVQHQPDAFILSFFEVWPPPIIGESNEEKQRAIDSIESIEARCVARLVVTPSKMKEFLAVMNENLANYQRLMQVLSTESKED